MTGATCVGAMDFGGGAPKSAKLLGANLNGPFQSSSPSMDGWRTQCVDLHHLCLPALPSTGAPLFRDKPVSGRPNASEGDAHPRLTDMGVEQCCHRHPVVYPSFIFHLPGCCSLP